MLVLKPSEVGGKSAHSTYETNILGEVVGVPDAKINAWDIMTEAFKKQYEKILTPPQVTAVVTPYGHQGIREVVPPAVAKRMQKADGINEVVRIAREEKFSDQQIIEYLKEEGYSDTEISDAVGEKIKKAPTVEKILGIPKESQEELKLLKRRLREQGKGARAMQGLKEAVIRFIKKNIPLLGYSKGEINTLLTAVKNVKTPNDMNGAIERVSALVVKKEVQNVEGKIDKVLKGKYEALQAQRKVGTKISVETQERIKRINTLVAPKSANPEEIAEINETLLTRLNKLSQSTTMTEEMLEEMVDIETAMYYNGARLLDDSDIKKLSDLETVEKNLTELIDKGRTELKEELAKAHEHYKKIIAESYKDITQENLEEGGERKRATEFEKFKNKERIGGRVKNTVNKIIKAINSFFVSHEALGGLIDIISKSPGDMFGGKLQELTRDRINNASYEFKKGMMDINLELQSKLADILGKNWKRVLLKNRQINPTGIYLDPPRVKEINKELKIEKDKRKRKKLEKEKSELEIHLSQDQAYYLYNQFKDPANHPGFESKYHEHYEEIMEGVTKFLNPKVKEWADWQTDVLFPKLYEAYNPVYRAIYRTNMPWNKFYSGRIIREGVELDPIDLMAGNTQYQKSIGGASTKVRIRNKKPIAPMNGNDMLYGYLQDMEFFKAYAEPLRDVQKILNNSDVRNAIEMTAGKDVLYFLDHKIKAIANRGIDATGAAKIVNAFLSAFITSRLGLNPTVMLKQLTSSIAFSADIKFENWLAYAPKSIAAFRSTWKEIVANSPYVKDRYEADIRRSLEAYSESGLVEFIPKSSGEKFIDILMWFVKTGDKGGIMGGLPNYLYYKDKYRAKHPNASEQEAIDGIMGKWQQEVKDAQQSGDIQDKDFWQSHPYLRAFNLFLTTPKAYQRKVNSSLRQLYRKTRGKSSKGSVRSNIENFFMYHTLLPTFFQWLVLGLPGLLADWDEEDEEALGRAALVGNINAFFIVGDIATGIVDLIEEKPWAGEMDSIGILQQSERIFDLYKKYRKAKAKKTKAKYWNLLMAEMISLSGFPAGNLYKAKINYEAVLSGEEPDMGKALLRLFNYGEYTINPPSQKKKKKKGKLSKAQLKEFFPDYYEQLQGQEKSDARKEFKELQKQVRD